MTTVRGSAMSSAAAGDRFWTEVGPTWLPALPAVPDTGRIRAGLAPSLVKALGVVHLGLREGPRAGDGRRALGIADDGESASVPEVGDVQDAEHHNERA